MIGFNLKIAFRSIWKNKVFSGINILGLALSMAACVIISLFVLQEYTVDHFHRNLENIYRVTAKQNQAGSLYNVAVTPGPLAPSLKQVFPEVMNTVRFGYWSGMVKNGTKSYEQKNIQLTDNSIFKTFSFPLLTGNSNTALLSPGEVVITERVAEQYFGKDWRNNHTLGSQLFTLNNEDVFKLVGVAENPPAGSSIQFDVLLPITFLFNKDKFSYNWNSNNFHTYVQLKDGTDAVTFQRKILKHAQVNNPGTTDQLLLQPLARQYLHSAFDFRTDWGNRGDIKYLTIFSGVGVLLLIIACVNFVTLSTARSVKRSLEVGVRKVNGASRRHLVFQFLAESVLFSCAAAVLAACMISVARPLLNSISHVPIETSLLNSRLLLVLLCMVAITGLLAGLYPAFLLSAYKPARIFRKMQGSTSGSMFRKGLVVAQFAISVTLIICTVGTYRQLRFMQQKDLGFDKAQLVSIRLGGQTAEKAALVKKDFAAVTGVTAVAPATMSLVNVENSSYLEWDGMQESEKFLITQANVDPDFIPALGMHMVSGRNFSAAGGHDSATYIVNESAVRQLGLTTASVLNKQVNFWGTRGRIIGVVKDFHFKPLSSGIDPFIFRHQPGERYFNMFVKVHPAQSRKAMEDLEKVYKRYEASTPFEYHFVSETIANSYRNEKRMATLILLFSGLTIFVGCMGLFGLAVFSAEQRTREIGIRKVLGAGVLSITALLSKDFIKLVFIAICIAVPVAWYTTNQWLQNYAYRVDPAWWVFAGTGLAVIGIALVTVSFQSIKTALANPVKSLRSE